MSVICVYNNLELDYLLIDDMVVVIVIYKLYGIMYFMGFSQHICVL